MTARKTAKTTAAAAEVEPIVADLADGTVTAVGELLPAETDEQRDERHHAKSVRDADDAAQRDAETKTTATARRRRRTRDEITADKLRAAAAKLAADAAPVEPKLIDVEFLLDRGGSFRIHKPGCRDIAKEVGEAGNYEAAVSEKFADAEHAMRELWSDQIAESWDGDADAEPPFEWLVAHGYAADIVILPCVARKLRWPAAAKPETATAASGRAVRVARTVTTHGEPPAGYLVLKSTPNYDQFRKADPAADGPEWLTRCNAHGETTSFANRKAGRTGGSASSRAQWCGKCKADARKRARAAATETATADAGLSAATATATDAATDAAEALAALQDETIARVDAAAE